jgi:hypothetical protein
MFFRWMVTVGRALFSFKQRRPEDKAVPCNVSADGVCALGFNHVGAARKIFQTVNRVIKAVKASAICSQ